MPATPFTVFSNLGTLFVLLATCDPLLGDPGGGGSGPGDPGPAAPGNIVSVALADPGSGPVPSSDTTKPTGNEPLFQIPAEFSDFNAGPTEPIFSGAGDGHWDAKIRERGWILRDGNQWQLWYTGYDGSKTGIRRLGRAVSSDGLRWQREPATPLLDELWVEDVHVTRHNGQYVMVAEGRNDQAQWLISADGIQWQPRGTLRIVTTTGEPIPAGPFGTPALIQHGDTWYLLYERRDAGIWLASSTGFAEWKHVTDEPVMLPGPDEYDRQMIALNQILPITDGQITRWMAVYHGSGDPVAPRKWNSALAISNDLRRWTKFAGNPVVRNNESSGQFVHDGEKWRLYTMHDSVRVRWHSPKPTGKQSVAQPQK